MQKTRARPIRLFLADANILKMLSPMPIYCKMQKIMKSIFNCLKLKHADAQHSNAIMTIYKNNSAVLVGIAPKSIAYDHSIFLVMLNTQ